MKSLILLLLLFPFSLAEDCSQTFSPEWCQEIQTSNLSEIEKQYLLSDLFSAQKYYPDYDLAKKWNLAHLPEIKHSQEIIKDAYLKIYIHPSLWYNQSLLVNTSGEIVAIRGYNLELPKKTDNEDCATYHSLWQEQEILRYYINNQLTSPNYLIYSTTAEFKVEYYIKVIIKIEHHQWQKSSCEYSHTTFKTEELTLTDAISAQIYLSKLNNTFQVKDYYDNNYLIYFKPEYAVNAELNLFHSYFKQHYFRFIPQINSTFLIIKAEPQVHQEFFNLAFSDEGLVIPELISCQIKLSDFFQELVLPCNLSTNHPEIIVNLPKLIYDDGDLILGTIFPINSTLNYAGKNYTSLNFTAIYPYHKISVSYQDTVFYYIIQVKNPVLYPPLILLIIFLLAVYLIFILMRCLL